MDFKGLSDPVVISNKSEGKPGIFQKLRPPSTNFLKNKKLLGGALTVMLLFAVGLGVYISQKPTQLAPQASSTAAEISLKPTVQIVEVNQQFQSDIFLNANNFSITVAQVKVTFDSTKLQLISTTPGDFLPTVLSPPVNTTGSTTFTVLSNPAKTGSGKIATLTFKPLAATSTPTKIEFDTSYTQAAADGSTSSVISAFLASDVTITSISSPQPSASPISCQNNGQCSAGYYCRPTGGACPDVVNGGTCINFGVCDPISSPKPLPSSPQNDLTSCQSDSECSSGYSCRLTYGMCTDYTNGTCYNFGSCQPTSSPYPAPSSPPNDVDTTKGDGNDDGTINLQDLSSLFSNWSPAVEITSHFKLDFNDDKKINSFDYSKMNELLKQLGVLRS